MNSYKSVLSRLRESTTPLKKVVFSFGRSSPPTKGHAINMDEVMDIPGDHYLFFSHSFDNKKNPVDPQLKLKVLKAMRPAFADHMYLTDKSMPSVIQIAKFLAGKGYQHLVMAVGDDRVDDFTTLLNKYNGKEYSFDKIEVITSGSRDPDVSGTKMREWAMEGNFARFRDGLDDNVPEDLAKELYDHVRENLAAGVSKVRESYISGQLFKIGTVVVDEANNHYQVVDRGPSFIKVIDTSGQIHRRWLDSVTEAVDSTGMMFETKIQKGKVQFKGFTAHLPTQVARKFSSILEAKDSFAVLAALRATAAFYEAKDVVEMKSAFDRSGKFLNNLGVISEHSYRDAMEELIAEAVMKDIPSILKITKQDRTKTAEFIASAVGSKDKGTPEEVINAAAKFVAKDDPSDDLLPIYGEMFSLADEVGITWNKDIFNTHQQKLMGFVEKVDESFIDHVMDIVAEHVTSFSDIIEYYSANELVVVGKRSALLEEFEGETNTDKAIAAVSKEPAVVKVKEPSTRKQLLSKARRMATKFIHDRKMWKTMKIIDDKDRRKLETIFSDNGSVITASTRKLADKVGAVEMERLAKLTVQTVTGDDQ